MELFSFWVLKGHNLKDLLKLNIFEKKFLRAVMEKEIERIEKENEEIERRSKNG